MRKMLLPYVFLSLFFQTHARVQSTNNALLFNGTANLATGSYIELPNPRNRLEFTTGTVEMWLKPTFTTQNRCFFSEKTSVDTRFSLHMAADNTIGIWNETTYSTTPVPFSLNTWVHVAVVVTSSTASVYLNGVFQNTINTGLNSAVSGTIPRIGVTGDATSNESWQGGIDQVRIWRSARTGTQIQSDMNDVTTVNDPNLIVYYDFNQGTGNGDNTAITSVIDRSTNAYNGTLKNFALTAGSTSNFIEYSSVLSVVAPVRLFVNTAVSSSGDGTTWATAKKTLTEALDLANAATSEYTIYVAKGTYTPGTLRTSSFTITKDSILLYGGYTGNETDLSIRDPKNNRTILSGDIGIANNNSDNCNHILLLVSTTGRQIKNDCIIDGFTVSGGYAQGSPGVTVNGKYINATSGAGIMIDASGAGNECSPKINNCIFLSNLSLGEFINDEDFVGEIPAQGGALSIRADSFGKANPLITNCVFRGNGGDIIQGAALFTDCHYHGTSSPFFSNCVFTGNYGGAEMIYDYAADFATSTLSIINCTFYNNNPSNLVTPYGSNGNLLVSIANSIIQKGSQGMYDESESTVYDINNTISQYGYVGNGNTASSEFSYFTNPSNPAGADGIWRTADDGLTLKSCASAINSGNNAVAAATDITGQTRILNNIVDRGAYEGIPNVITLSSQTVNNQAFVADGCIGNTWTYYSIPNQPGKLSFAISWGANTAARNAATIYVNTDDTNTVQTSATTGIAAMRRYWNVDLHGTPLNVPVQLRFYYDTADIANMNTSLNGIGPLSGVKWFKTTGNAYAPSQISLNTINNGNYILLNPTYGVQDGIPYVEFAGISSFSGGTAIVTAAADILPVTLTSFRALPKDCDIALSWTVADAVNFKQYELQRSENGTDFTTIAVVTHKPEQSLYQYTDASLPKQGNYLYRLKLVDIDGKYKLSAILSVSSTCETNQNKVVIGPNPVLSECTVRLFGNIHNVSVTLNNIDGRQLYSTSIKGSATSAKIPMGNLPAGIYSVIVRGNDGSVVSKKIIKQ